ncbi:membrane peptidoglycan carboxypeptidase [Frondihabitans sp. PhB188]|uniref:transglycosylase domain-containing protein n=1 Tax=Frondihabitans sp. PhB188 TaxID=2485200 RepID=UPI000F491B43|nr:transglycosylase domain-containing protein [Frondihabitans sp. PhB188]ROQ36729.1 membrane peptidoglycan carboxypeptidase [Frondihabitans sp. PhB188]
MSAQKKRPTSVVGAVFGFVGFSALAGLLVTIGVTPALAVSSVTASSSIGIFESLPEYISIGQLQQRNTLYGESGGKQVPFATIYSQNRVNLKWDEVSPNLKHAVVAGEDKRFYQHGGVDLTSIVRAGVGSLSGGLGESGGGSTLTMQLVRNIRLAQAQDIKDPKKQAAAIKDAKEVTVSRKLQEMKYAIGLEKKYSKDEILLAYLNIAYFGDQTYGVQAAAQHYYNKSAKSLTPTQAASLIAIVQYPESRDLSTPKNYKNNVARRNVILKAMEAQGYITADTLKRGLETKVGDSVKLTPAVQGCAAVTAGGAQQFCDYVTSPEMIKSYAFLGGSDAARTKNWNTGGYKVHTTINLDLTANAKGQIDQWAPATFSQFPLGGVVDSVEPGTGRVVVMTQNKNLTTDASASLTGPNTYLNYSVDTKYGSSQGFQVGSTYKMFTLLDWLEKGHGVNELVDATPRTFPTMTVDGGTYSTVDGEFPQGYKPKNDEGYISGYMTVKTATAASVNVAYASMAQQLDLADIRDVAQKLGVHTATGAELKDNTSSFLGTNNIAPLTMATAYAAIANKGVYCPSIVVDKVTTPDGKSVAGQKSDCQQVVDPDVAATAISAMQGVFQGGGTASGALPDATPEFGKTGTTDDADQIWLNGSTTALTTVTWMGDTSGQRHSLRQYSSPVYGQGTLATSRSGLFKAVQGLNNTVYPGTAFPIPSGNLATGNGVKVPALTGNSVDAAKNLLSGVGLNYVDGGTQASSQPEGQVAGTSPGEGSLVPNGGNVTVYTSDGSQAATVPELSGKSLKDALGDLEDAGFDTSKVTTGFAKSDDDQKCDVVSSNPGDGASAAKDSAIALTVGGGKSGRDPGNCS